MPQTENANSNSLAHEVAAGREFVIAAGAVPAGAVSKFDPRLE